VITVNVINSVNVINKLKLSKAHFAFLLSTNLTALLMTKLYWALMGFITVKWLNQDDFIANDNKLIDKIMTVCEISVLF
jgi:hypothetical protein